MTTTRERAARRRELVFERPSFAGTTAMTGVAPTANMSRLEGCLVLHFNGGAPGELLLESGEAFGSLLCRFHGHEVLDLRGEGRRRFSTLAGRR